MGTMPGNTDFAGNADVIELVLLRFVVEALGLDTEKLRADIESNHMDFWRVAALRCATCFIDPNKANAVGLTAERLADAQQWFESLRRADDSRL